MVSSKSLVYDFDLIFDRFKGELKRNIRLEDKMRLLNRAQELYLERFARLAEVNSSARDVLRVLEEKEIVLKPSIKREDFTVFKFPKNFYRLLAKRAVVTKNDCPKKEIPLITFQTDDLNYGRNNFFWKSSYEWENIIFDEGSKGMYVYHDDKGLKVHNIVIDYYRKPTELHAPTMSSKKSYIDWNGVERSLDTNCDLDTNFSPTKIVNIAVLMGRATFGDLQDFRTLLEQEIQIDNISY
jgi:hypothetical protein